MKESRERERERAEGGREVCVILSMLFVLTSCSLLPDRKRPFRDTGVQREREEDEPRRGSESS